jgi:hypothetical protein
MIFLLVSWQHPLAGTFRSRRRADFALLPANAVTAPPTDPNISRRARQRRPIRDHRRLSHLGQLAKPIPRRHRYSDKSP